MISRRPHWWQWPTILSLDAPAVVVAWQAMLFEVAGRGCRFAPLFVLAASVWLAYAADRWIEGWRVHPASIRTQRHAFHQRRRWEIAAVWCAVFAADVWVAMEGLSRREFAAGAWLIAPVAAYLLSHQLVHRHHPWRVPKEICIAVLLAGGVAVFPAAGADVRPILLAEPLILFVLFAFANCALISRWERAVDRSHGQTSLAQQFRSGPAAGRWVAVIGVMLGLAGLTSSSGAVAAVNGAGVASGLLLLLIDQTEHRLGWEAARILADAALLTPAVALVWRAIVH